jgi:hypothetical protein
VERKPPLFAKETVLKVTVTPEATAGTSKGGEDLHLVVRVRVEGETPPTTLEGSTVEFEQSGTCQLDADVDDDGEPVLFKVRTFHYDFEWEGTAEDVLGLRRAHKPDLTVGERLLDPSQWTFGHSPGQEPFLVFEYRHFVEGNAD